MILLYQSMLTSPDMSLPMLYLFSGLFILSVVLNIGAAVVGFGKMKMFGKYTCWIGLAASFLLLSQAGLLFLGISMAKSSEKASIISAFTWVFSLALSPVCMIIGVMKSKSATVNDLE